MKTAHRGRIFQDVEHIKKNATTNLKSGPSDTFNDYFV
jgi:hypothetical protein